MIKNVKVLMSMEVQIKVDETKDELEQKEYCKMAARNYLSCIGAKDIQVDSIEWR